MKRKILSVLSVLMAVLMALTALAACEKTPAGADSSGGGGESLSTEQSGEPSVSESGGGSGAQTGTEGENKEPIQKITAIVLSNSFATYGIEPTFSEDFAKASFLGYFAPMLVTLADYDDFDSDSISAEEAFDCFETFLSESRDKITNYDEIPIKYEEYLQYYPAEIVEDFVLKRFGTAAESMKKLPSYNGELDAYERLYYGGITKGKAEITAVRLSEPNCEIDFSCRGFLHSTETISGTAVMKYTDGGFVLSGIQFG
ncbi:MAG: hypothetical protein MR987_03565 [Oscillospiraceae bacterium]|nr:hypothetical protein [Oscillospiraceae bacterium]